MKYNSRTGQIPNGFYISRCACFCQRVLVLTFVSLSLSRNMSVVLSECLSRRSVELVNYKPNRKRKGNNRTSFLRRSLWSSLPSLQDVLRCFYISVIRITTRYRVESKRCKCTFSLFSVYPLGNFFYYTLN